MSSDSLPDEWSIIRVCLPWGLDALAKEKKFPRRAKVIQDSETWLRFFLTHVVGGFSLKQTAVRASEFGLPKFSAMALIASGNSSEGRAEAARALEMAQTAGDLEAVRLLNEKIPPPDSSGSAP